MEKIKAKDSIKRPFIVPLECTIRYQWVANSTSAKGAMRIAIKQFRDSYEGPDSAFLEGPYVKNSMTLDFTKIFEAVPQEEIEGEETDGEERTEAGDDPSGDSEMAVAEQTGW